MAGSVVVEAETHPQPFQRGEDRSGGWTPARAENSEGFNEDPLETHYVSKSRTMSVVESDVAASAPPDSVESDPNGRYWRFEDVLGSGACKTVFKAFDSREGIEVAWNKVSLCSASDTHITTMRKRLFSEIHVLKRLQHKNIMTFHDSWIDQKTNALNFITELFTDGSLKRFRSKHRHLELQVLKKWAWQILQGLVYLHGHDPPIIHRDLKCDNIFINGVSGDLKIGDLGLATLWTSLAPLSVIGTPEFMAPELYNENYDEKVDVYAFGMLLLELVSMDYPYCECTNPASIYKRVSQGVYPASFQKIKNHELKEFIELCIAYEPEKRPEARQLLKHQFFSSLKKSMEPHRNEKSEVEISSVPDRSNSEMDSNEDGSNRTSPEANGGGGVFAGSSRSSSRSNYAPGDLDQDPVPGLRSIPGNDRVNIKIGCTKIEGERILYFSLEYQKPGGTIQTIQFPFNIDEDTADQIIREMRDESDHEIPITEEEAMTIGQLICEEVDKWRLKDEAQLEAYVNVTRKSMVDPTQEVEISDQDSDEVRMRLESKVEDLCETMAAGQGRTHYFKALDEHSSGIMDCMDSTWRTPQKLRILTEEDPNWETGLDEEQVLFSNSFVKDQTPGLDLQSSSCFIDQSPQDEECEIKSEKSIGVEIPKRRRMSENLERSLSISSTFSESRLHHSLEAGNHSPFGKSTLRRWSTKNFSTRDFPPSNSVRSALRTTLNSTKEGQALEDRSMADQTSPEVSFVYLEPSLSQGEISINDWTGGGASPGAGPGKPDGPEQDLTKPQGTNPSLISLVKVKPSTPSGGGGGGISTLTELTLKQQPILKTVRRSVDMESAKSKADEYAWKIANAPLVPDSEGTGGTSQPLTPENSPRSSNKYLDSNATVSSTELCVRSQELPVRESDSTSASLKPLSSAPEPRRSPISEELFQEQASKKPDSIRAFRKNSSEGRASDVRKTIQFGDRSDLSVEARHNLDRMFKSYADLPNARPGNRHRGSWDLNTKELDTMFQFDAEFHDQSSALPDPFGSFNKTSSVSNLPVHSSNHQGKLQTNVLASDVTDVTCRVVPSFKVTF